MNTLSWLLYIADVAGSLNSLCGLVTLIGCISLLIWAVFGFITTGEAGKDEWAIWRNIGFRLLAPAAVISALIGGILPSRETVYAIAASEMGDRALSTETGGKAVKALNAWLDRQITPEKESAQ